jgi:8-oxo-dGTP diphosphatase
VTAQSYDPRSFPPFAVTVDIVVLAVTTRLEVLVVERGLDPFLGSWALPGGFVQPEESIDEAAERELLEETGLTRRSLSDVHLEQVGTFGAVDRDPRMRVVSVAYLALSPIQPDPIAGTDAAAAHWVAVDEALAASLAFDHHEILTVAVERARAKLEYTTLATSLAGSDFTLGELQHVYETVWDHRLDRANFRRKVLATKDFVVPTGERRTGKGGGAPGAAYSAGEGQVMSPPLMRSDVKIEDW